MKIKVTVNDPKFKHLADDMNRVFDDMDKVFKSMDKTFDRIGDIMDQVQQESWEAINKRQKWEPYISWIPRKIGRRWYWHSPIYRKYQHDDGKGYFIYGTEFDVLKETL